MIKVGDIVKIKALGLDRRAPGVVTDVIDRKCWRTEKLGKSVDWSKIDPEPHAVVLFSSGTMEIPVVDLEIVLEK